MGHVKKTWGLTSSKSGSQTCDMLLLLFFVVVVLLFFSLKKIGLSSNVNCLP